MAPLTNEPSSTSDDRLLTAVAHLHTSVSWDGNIPPARMIDALDQHGVQLAVVTDHDSFQGAVECRRLVAERGLDIQIPLAAEIRTERGDVIVVFDADVHELPAVADLKDWENLKTAVRGTGGLIWLPHPFQSHEYVEELAAESDVIEVFNARCTAEQNRNADLLCARHRAAPAFGADVHRLAEVGRCVVTYPDKGSVISTLQQPPQPVRTLPSLRSSILAAEMTYAWRKRRWQKLTYNGLRWMQARRHETRMGGSG